MEGTNGCSQLRMECEWHGPWLVPPGEGEDERAGVDGVASGDGGMRGEEDQADSAE